MRNKKGSVLMYSMMLGLTIILVGLALAPAVQSFTTTAMNESSGDTVGLDCNNDSISTFDKATCIATDSLLFYFIGSIILIGGAIVTARVVFA